MGHADADADADADGGEPSESSGTQPPPAAAGGELEGGARGWCALLDAVERAVISSGCGRLSLARLGTALRAQGLWTERGGLLRELRRRLADAPAHAERLALRRAGCLSATEVALVAAPQPQDDPEGGDEEAEKQELRRRAARDVSADDVSWLLSSDDGPQVTVTVTVRCEARHAAQGALLRLFASPGGRALAVDLPRRAPRRGCSRHLADLLTRPDVRRSPRRPEDAIVALAAAADALQVAAFDLGADGDLRHASWAELQLLRDMARCGALQPVGDGDGDADGDGPSGDGGGKVVSAEVAGARYDAATGGLAVTQARFRSRLPPSARGGVVRVRYAGGASVTARVKERKGREVLLQPLGPAPSAPEEDVVEAVEWRAPSGADAHDRDAALLGAFARSLVQPAAGRRGGRGRARGDVPLLAELSAASRPPPPPGGGDADGGRPWHLLDVGGGSLNPEQRAAVAEALATGPGTRSVLVHGPPGTGKTRAIREAAALWCRFGAALDEGEEQRATNESARTAAKADRCRCAAKNRARRSPVMVCCARSNVAALNIALALSNRGHSDGHSGGHSGGGGVGFRLVVSSEFHDDWHEHLYAELRARLGAGAVCTTKEAASAPTAPPPTDVIVCTVATLASDLASRSDALLRGRSVRRLVVDEASQVYAGDLLALLWRLRRGGATGCGAPGCPDRLRCVAMFGDDRQLPPFAFLPDRPVRSAFDAHLIWGRASRSPALRACALTACHRLPPTVGAFVSRHVYGGALTVLSSSIAPLAPARDLLWLDVPHGCEQRRGGSVLNPAEAAAVVAVARALAAAADAEGRPQGRPPGWRVISMYDAQRGEIERQLRAWGPAGPQGATQDRVYNVDAFQGREDDVIIASLARTADDAIGFLRDDRRINVMLTRCRRRLVVVGRLASALAHPETLIGRLAAACRDADLVRTDPASAAL